MTPGGRAVQARFLSVLSTTETIANSFLKRMHCSLLVDHASKTTYIRDTTALVKSYIFKLMYFILSIVHIFYIFTDISLETY